MRTEPEPVPAGTARRSRNIRRAFLALVAVVVVAGALGLLGVRTADRTVRAGGHELTVHYAVVARPGLAAPWSLTIRRDEPFEEGEKVLVRLRAAYFDLFDENGFDPDVESSTADGEYLLQEFAAPAAGNTLELSFDARIEPAVQSGERGSAAVLDDDGKVLAEVTFKTWIVP